MSPASLLSSLCCLQLAKLPASFWRHDKLRRRSEDLQHHIQVLLKQSTSLATALISKRTVANLGIFYMPYCYFTEDYLLLIVHY